MIAISEFRRDILQPTLERLGRAFEGEAAENLILGTIAQESGFRHLRQISGPALGLIQIEPATLTDLYENYLSYRPELRQALDGMRGAWPERESAVQGNLFYACAVCRLQYGRDPQSLPAHDDIEGLARYWKRVWNTEKGRGTVAQFVLNYRTHIDGPGTS